VWLAGRGEARTSNGNCSVCCSGRVELEDDTGCTRLAARRGDTITSNKGGRALVVPVVWLEGRGDDGTSI
jgi:hypothetical protein